MKRIRTHKNPNKLVLALFPWKKDEPMALEFGGWKKREEAMREKYPVRYFLFFIVPHNVDIFFQRNIKRPIHDAKWAILHRFHPKHQYNILKPRTLKPGYYDPDTRILHACMHELSVYFETDAKKIKWTATDHHKHAYAEMKAIYKWWNKARPAAVKRESELLDKWSDARFGKNKSFFDSTKKDSKKAQKLFEQHNALEELIYKTDEEMLIRLMKIRLYLWF